MKTIKILLAAVACSVMAMACTPQKSVPELLPVESFQKTVDGKPVSIYNLKNKNGIVAQITNYGARIVSLWTPDKNGNMGDVVLGMADIDSYQNAYELFYGAVVGRSANRIGQAKFTLDSIGYVLPPNDNGNQLHGGAKGFYKVVWDARPFVNENGEEALELSYLSPSGEEGYPGNLYVKVTYTLTDDNALRMDYWAEADEPTVVNLTNHAYFNLSGKANKSINDHILTINADYFTPTDSTLIPTGELTPVEGTPMDFRAPAVIGKRVDEPYPALLLAGGYDHNYVLNKTGNEMSLAATVIEPSSGRKLEVWTSEPAVQFYGGNFINGTDTGKWGEKHGFRTAFCLEAQHYPDSPNQPEFPSTALRPGDVYSQTTLYKFDVQR